MKDEQSKILSEPLVSARDHYEILKFAEEAVKEKLGSIEHDWMLVGVRVSYYELPPEDSEELGEEHKMECGYLEPIDYVEEIEVETAEEWERIVEEGRHKNPLPIEFVDKLYEEVKRELEKRAGGQELLVGVCGVLMGSTFKCWGSSCTCWKYGKFYRRYYYYSYFKKRCVSYCTSIKCRYG